MAANAASSYDSFFLVFSFDLCLRYNRQANRTPSGNCRAKEQKRARRERGTGVSSDGFGGRGFAHRGAAATARARASVRRVFSRPPALPAPEPRSARSNENFRRGLNERSMVSFSVPPRLVGGSARVWRS